MPKQGETQFLSIDQFFDHLKGEVIAKKGKGSKSIKFAIPPFINDLEGVPVFTSDEELEDYITKIFTNIPYTVYEIRDGKIVKVK